MRVCPGDRGLCAAFAWPATVQAHTPVFVSLTVTPTTLPADGGEVTIRVSVREAATCTVYFHGLGAPRTLDCASGHATYRKLVPANTGPVAAGWLLYGAARDGRPARARASSRSRCAPQRRCRAWASLPNDLHPRRS